MKNRSDSHVSFQESRWGAFGILVREHHPPTTTTTPNTRTPFNMWTGLTSNISPRRNTIATQETISAWFWMTNSWLSTGGFLVVFFRIPISARFGPTFLFFFLNCVAQRRCGRLLSDTVVVVECEDAQSSLLLPTSNGPGCN